MLYCIAPGTVPMVTSTTWPAPIVPVAVVVDTAVVPK